MDCVEFDTFARNLAEGHGYTNSAGRASAFRAPGFPMLLASLYVVAGPNPVAAYLLFAALGGLSTTIGYLAAQQVLPERTARIVGGLIAVYPPLIYFATLFVSENLFVPAFGTAIYALLAFTRTGSLKLAVVSGFALGVSILTRPFAVLALPVLLAIAWWTSRGGRAARARVIAVLLLATATVLAPWVVRNHRVFGQFVFVATNGGSTFYGGNNDLVSGELSRAGGWVSTVDLPHRSLIEAAQDEVSHDRVEWQLGFKWLRENPKKVPTLLLAKFTRFWLPELSSDNRRFTLLQVVGTTGFIVLALNGMWMTARSKQYRTAQWLLLHSAMGATLLNALVFWGSPRFRDGNAVVLMLYAGVALARLAERLRPGVGSAPGSQAEGG